MERTLIAIDADDLARVEAKIDALLQKLATANVTPAPDWLSVQEYAKMIGRSERTVREWSKLGRVETRRAGNVLQIRR